MGEPKQYILDEWDSMCAKANKALHSDCPLPADEVLVEMHKYVSELCTARQPTTNVMFSAKVVIGIGGVTVLDLIEYCHPDWSIEPDESLELVKYDIERGGAQLWLERVFSNTKQDYPKEHGIYKINGGALFLSDDVEYTRLSGFKEIR